MNWKGKPQTRTLIFVTLLGLMLGVHSGFVLASTSIRFTDVAEEAGVTLLNVCGGPRKNYILEVNGNGAAFFDYDNDSDMDLAIVNGSTLEDVRQGNDLLLALYQNSGKSRFNDVTPHSGLQKKGWGMGVCVADYDNDSFQDIYITAYGPNTLFRNKGDGSFQDMTHQAGVGDPRWSTNCAFADYDRDGDVDLYVANYLVFDKEKIPKPGANSLCRYMGMDVVCGPRGLEGEPDALYRNNGDGTFTDVTETAGIHDPGYYGFGVIFSDLDNDGWLDIYVANDSTPNLLFHNNRDGTFSEVALFSGASLSENAKEQASMGVDAGDYNGDGYFDLFVTNFSQDYNTLYQNHGNGIFSDSTSIADLKASSLPYLGWGTGFVDFDNDGLLDIFLANGHLYPDIDHYALGSTFVQPNQLYRNLGNGRFQEIKLDDLSIAKSSRGAAFGDYDNDGDLDVAIVNLNDRPTLLRNEVENNNHWVTLHLVGTRSNRDAIGARVVAETNHGVQVAEVRSGGSYLSHNDSRLHFGLGKANRIKRLQIRWPSGLLEEFQDLEVDVFFVLTEDQGLEIKTSHQRP